MVYLGTTVSIYRHLKTHFIQNDRFSYCLVLFRQNTQSTTVGFQQGFIRPEKHLLVMIILNLLLYTCQKLPCRVVYGYTKYSCEYNLWRVPYLVIIPLHCILILTVMLCVGENLFWPEPPDNPHIHASLTFTTSFLPHSNCSDEVSCLLDYSMYTSDTDACKKVQQLCEAITCPPGTCPHACASWCFKPFLVNCSMQSKCEHVFCCM